MPQQPFADLPGEIIEHRMFDGDEVLAVVSYSKLIEQRGQGPPTTVTRGDSFRTVDDFIYNPIYGTGQDPIFLAVCHVCRHPTVGLLFVREKPCHGLCTLPNARQCHRCGITVCPKHRESRQGRSLCRRCATRRRFWKLIKPLFFRRVQE